MFLRLRKPAAAPIPPVKDKPEDPLDYFTHQPDTRPIPPMSALDQMYAYYTAE